MEADSGLGSGRVTRELKRLIEQRGQPESVRSDNGPEFTSRRMLGWAEEHTPFTRNATRSGYSSADSKASAAASRDLRNSTSSSSLFSTSHLLSKR